MACYISRAGCGVQCRGWLCSVVSCFLTLWIHWMGCGRVRVTSEAMLPGLRDTHSTPHEEGRRARSSAANMTLASLLWGGRAASAPAGQLLARCMGPAPSARAPSLPAHLAVRGGA